MENLKNELKFKKNGQEYEDGYRIVYFYENNEYVIGEYCKTMEGFMIGFAGSDPLIDEEDIPKFISIDDLLNRYLEEVENVISVALYKTDGTCVQKNNKVQKNK